MDLMEVLTAIMFTLKLLGKLQVGWVTVFLPSLIDLVVKIIVVVIAVKYKD